MGNETTYLGVMGGLIRLISALNANAADLAPLDGARLHLAKIVVDLERVARQQTAFTASKQEVSQQLWTPKSPPPSEPAVAAPAPKIVQ